MGFHCSGVLNIPSEEFWEWVYAETKESEVFIKSLIRIDVGVGELVLETNKNEYGLPLEAFWGFAHQYLPKLSPAEWRCGVPRLSEYDLEIDFCANTESIEDCVAPEFISIIEQWESVKDKGRLFLLSLPR